MKAGRGVVMLHRTDGRRCGAAGGAGDGFGHVGPSASRLAVLLRLRGSLPTQADSFRLRSGGGGEIHYRKCWPARSARVEGEISVNTGGCHGIIYSTKMTGLQAVPFNVSLHIFYGAGANDRLNRYGYGTLVFACTTATGTRTSANRTPTRGGRRVTKSPSSGHGFYGRSEHIWPGGFRSVVIHGR